MHTINQAKKILLFLLVFVALVSCFQSRGELVETTIIVTEKTTREKHFYVKGQDLKKTNEYEVSKEIWDKIATGQSITFRFKDSQPVVKAIDNLAVYKELNGTVKDKLIQEQDYMLILEFDQIGEYINHVSKNEWDKLSEGQKVIYNTDTWGNPNVRIK
ncbi:MAG: hypothetical protein ACQEXQ_29825 [Bacillota bacterium]